MRNSVSTKKLWLFFLVLLAAVRSNAACPYPIPELQEIVVKMPYPHDIEYEHDCHQGMCGTTSHHFLSTQYDLDLDTPNTGDPQPLLACIDGIAFVHYDACIGTHIKIDVGDGTYFIYAHLHEALVADGTPVRQGQQIASENNSGSCSSGDHLHFGRHYGDARTPGLAGMVSVPFHVWTREKDVEPDFRIYRSTEFVCCESGCPEYDSDNFAGCSTFANDLDCWHWAYEYWQEVVDRSIFSGTGCRYDPTLTCIYPEENITRAELSKVSMKSFGMSLDSPPPSEPFIDICPLNPSYPLHTYVATLYNNGIVQGRPSCDSPSVNCDMSSGQVFCPEDSITRAESLKILIESAKYMGYPINTPSCTAPPFPDVPVSHSLCAYVKAGKDQNFLNGYKDGTFGPNDSISRSEIAKLVANMLAKLQIP